MKSIHFLLRLLSLAVFLPVVLAWQGCPGKVDACSGTNAPVVRATVVYTLTYTTAGVLTNVLQSDVNTTWTATSPVGKYKILVKSIEEQGAPEVTLKDTIITGTNFRYAKLRLPNSNNTILVTPLGLDETPCENAKAELRIATPNSGTITIDIVGRINTTGTNSTPCVFDANGVSVKPFCSNVNDLFTVAKDKVSPSATKILIHLKKSGSPTACTTYTYTSWANLLAAAPHFLSSDVVPILPAFKTCLDITQNANIDFDDTPKTFMVQYPN